VPASAANLIAVGIRVFGMFWPFNSLSGIAIASLGGNGNIHREMNRG
jgi:hypothetical protein